MFVQDGGLEVECGHTLAPCLIVTKYQCKSWLAKSPQNSPRDQFWTSLHGPLVHIQYILWLNETIRKDPNKNQKYSDKNIVGLSMKEI